MPEDRLPLLVEAELQNDRNERETFLINSLFDPNRVDSLPIMAQNPLRLIHARYIALPATIANDQLALLYACLCAASFQETMTHLGDDGYRHMIDKESSAPREDVVYFNRAVELLSGHHQPSISSCCGWHQTVCADFRGAPPSSRLDGLLLRTR